MTFNILVGIATTLWLLSIAACGLAFRWSYLSVPRRFWPAVILSGLALLLGFLGLTRFHIVASKTVNGQVQWRFDSHWFFIVTLVLGGGTLAYALWKRKKMAAAV